MKNRALILHHEFIDLFRKLTVEEAGMIIKAIFEYDVHGTAFVTEDRLLDFVFGEVKRYLDSNREKYDRISQKKSENAKKQWEALAKAKKAEEKMQLHAAATNDNDNDNENNNDNDNANDSDSDSDSDNETAVISEDEAAARETQTHTQMKAYGEFGNVFLSDKQIISLRSRFADADKRIESLSAYMKSSGKLYLDHYAQLLNWRPLPTVTGSPLRYVPPGERREPTFDVSAFTGKAVGIKYSPPT